MKRIAKKYNIVRVLTNLYIEQRQRLCFLLTFVFGSTLDLYDPIKTSSTRLINKSVSLTEEKKTVNYKIMNYLNLY